MVSEYLLMKHDRRQDILAAAMELFAKKGFRGTTTRDLATQAEVNEAIIFRHFTNKEELYSAILEYKACENRDAHAEQLERLASLGDDQKFFQTVGNTFMKSSLLILLSLTTFVSACSTSNSQNAQRAQAASAPAPISIVAAKVETRELQRYIDAVGTLDPNEEVIVSNQVEGTVEKLF